MAIRTQHPFRTVCFSVTRLLVEGQHETSVAPGLSKGLMALEPCTVTRFSFSVAALILGLAAVGDSSVLAQPPAPTTDEERRAVLELVRTYRLAKNFPAAEKLLNDAIGTAAMPGWANSTDFRKEVAYLHEARGAALKGKAAKDEWSKALREWSTLANLLRNQSSMLPAASGRLAALNSYIEVYLLHQRCVVMANQQLLSDSPNPENATKLQRVYDKVANHFVSLERVYGADINKGVRDNYRAILMEIPELRKAYEAAGGKFFLESPPPAESNPPPVVIQLRCEPSRPMCTMPKRSTGCRGLFFRVFSR